MKAILVEQTGGPEQLTVRDVPIPKPGPSEVLVKVAVSGVNFIDVYYRNGVYKAPAPVALGSEAAGLVEALGSEVTGFAPADRVAYAMTRGSYAEYAIVPASQLVKVPDEVPLEEAAAALLQGMTAHYLTRSVYPLKRGDRCLVHAAAGGTGALIVQMAKQQGATVFATVSTSEKAAIAREAGADEVILYGDQDWVAEVRRMTSGEGVDVVYDGVGRSTFERGLDCIRRRGTMALFGAASGPVPPFDPILLNTKGSLFLTRPTLAHYIATRDELEWRAGDLFGMIGAGRLRIRIDETFPLVRAADAHRALEGRKTIGKLLLVP
ncbi:MAG: quinone oxidoreductase [Vicinamibacterales bacterium]